MLACVSCGWTKPCGQYLVAFYSARNAIIGSTLVARRAGTKAASSATHARAAVATEKLAISVVGVSYKSDDITRVAANAPIKPSAMPITARRKP